MLDYVFESGSTQNGTSGAALPILGVSYGVGSVGPGASIISSGANTNIMWGVLGTNWHTSAVVAGYWLKTSTGNDYKITEVISPTRLKMDRKIVNESTATYKIYRRPTTNKIYVQSNVENTNPYIFVAENGAVDASASPATGLMVSTGQGFKVFDVNLANTDLWIDVNSDDDVVDWAILKRDE